MKYLASVHEEQKQKAINLSTEQNHLFEKGTSENFYHSTLTPQKIEKEAGVSLTTEELIPQKKHRK